MNPDTRTNTVMTTAQQECQPIPSDGLTATISSPAISTHHNVQEMRQNQHSCHKTPSSSDPSSQTASLSLTPQVVSPIDATQSCDQGDSLRGTVSENSENQPLETLASVEDRISLEEASQGTVDSSHATLIGGVQSTQQPSPAPSSAAKPATTVSEGLDYNYNNAKSPLRPPITESLGLWACATIAGGTALTLAVLGFLVFLWAGEGPAGGERATYVWRKIMLSESWPAQTITICAVVVRTIAAAQAAICTSLVAALLLERRRLPLSKAVPVSIKRGVNDGPFNLLRDLLAWKSLERLFCVEMALLLLVTMVTFGIQFTSTLLLSGFDTTTLVQFPQQLHHNVLLSAETALNTRKLNSYAQFSPSYALFGELETSDTPDPNARGVSDTGVKLRSFVPFQEEQRTKLRAFTGPAFSKRSQVMCMRPSMDARVSWKRIITESGTVPTTSLSGTISYGETFEEAGLNDWTPCSSIKRFDGSSQTICLPQNFSCTLPMRDTTAADPLPVVALRHLPTEIVGNSQTSWVPNIQMWNRSSPLWSASANSWLYLAFSTNLTADAVMEEVTENENSSVSLTTPTEKGGEWHIYDVLPTMVLNVTLCFAGLETDLYNVSMSTAADTKEPEVRWDLTHGEDGAESGQRFMGTTGANLSVAERGIMSMTDFRPLNGLKVQDLDNSSFTFWTGPSGFTGMFSGAGDRSWLMCNFCFAEGWAIPPDIAALFARTIHTTGRAAWAIQTFLTTYTQSWYAQILPQFDVAADVDVTFSTQLRIPRHWGGLIAALVMVFVNLVCVWAITVLYVVHTRYSRQGNVWHTVSQIMSEDTRTVLEQSNEVRDEEVEKGLKADDYLVFVGKSKGSDKVSVLRS